MQYDHHNPATPHPHPCPAGAVHQGKYLESGGSPSHPRLLCITWYCRMVAKKRGCGHSQSRSDHPRTYIYISLLVSHANALARSVTAWPLLFRRGRGSRESFPRPRSRGRRNSDDLLLDTGGRVFDRHFGGDNGQLRPGVLEQT